MRILLLVLTTTALLEATGGFAEQPASAQLETTANFLKRMQPVLKRDAAVAKIEAEMKKVEIARLDEKNQPFRKVLDELNIAIRAHNSAEGTVQIPLIRVKPLFLHGTPEYEKMQREAPGWSNTMADKHISLSLGDIKLDEAVTYVTGLEGMMVNIEPGGIWLQPLGDGGMQVLMEKTYSVPAALCKTTVEKWFNGHWTDADTEPQSRKFDEKRRMVTLRWTGKRIDEFEKWYAGELVKAGFTAAGER
jgi:hypothetical protein